MDSIKPAKGFPGGIIRDDDSGLVQFAVDYTTIIDLLPYDYVINVVKILNVKKHFILLR
jgi:hypothetical protein